MDPGATTDTSSTDRALFSRFVAELPGDPSGERRPRQVQEACYSLVQPEPVSDPKLVAYSPEMARTLGFDAREFESREVADVLSGNAFLPGAKPHAACYGGHQFGNWAGQLGDGRAISLGELMGADGKSWELQLKGAGSTPYSRRADGRAVMRSSLREFLCSEAMHHLGIPTTRALSLVATGDQVMRDMFYDGRPRYEPGAIVCRVAPTFVRFGNFEIFASRGDESTLRALADFCVRHFFSDSAGAQGRPEAREYAAMFERICVLTAQMIVHWMRVGFVHGVMNTDNMSILGLTIDYGPYGWLEDFDPSWTPNTTDAHGRRYRFGNQPRVAEWNLAQLGNALMPLVEDAELLEAGLTAYRTHLSAGQARMVADKLGLATLGLDEPGDDGGPSSDRRLVDSLFDVLSLVETDMTLFYRGLAELDVSQYALENADPDRLRAPLEQAYYRPSQLTPDVVRQIDAWLRSYVQRALEDEHGSTERIELMKATNPAFVLRNYLVQIAIDEVEKGRPEPIADLMQALRDPYRVSPGLGHLYEKRPEWARNRPGCSMLSCSS